MDIHEQASGFRALREQIRDDLLEDLDIAERLSKMKGKEKRLIYVLGRLSALFDHNEMHLPPGTNQRIMKILRGRPRG